MKYKHIGWKVVSGDPKFWHSTFTDFYEIGKGGNPLNNDGTWIEGHPYHFKSDHKNFIVKEQVKIFVEDIND